jgi:hypothetical protein
MVFVPGESAGRGVRRLVVFAVGWGAFLALLLWGGYHQGLLHGAADGFIAAAILTLVAAYFGRDSITPPRPDGGPPY